MTISPEWKQEMDVGDKYWVGECKTCDKVLTVKPDEPDVQSTMQYHADYKDHDVSVYSERLRKVPLICPECRSSSSFRMYHDESCGSLEIKCCGCGGTEEFQDAFRRMVWHE